MELVDLFTAVVFVGMIGEAYVRMQLTRKTGEILEAGLSRGRAAEAPENINTALMSQSFPQDDWSPGLGSHLSGRPMLVFFVLVMVLGGVLYSVGLIATIPKMILATLALVLGLAFHSGPDQYTLSEYLLQTHASDDAESLGDRELGLLCSAKGLIERWAALETLFALGLMAGILIPVNWIGNYLLGLLLIMFLVLGYVYQIQKGIFAGPT